MADPFPEHDFSAATCIILRALMLRFFATLTRVVWYNKGS